MRRLAARALIIGILSLSGFFAAMPALHAELFNGRAVADVIWPNAAL
jgi:hypothetical protein